MSRSCRPIRGWVEAAQRQTSGLKIKRDLVEANGFGKNDSTQEKGAF